MKTRRYVINGWKETKAWLDRTKEKKRMRLRAKIKAGRTYPDALEYTESLNSENDPWPSGEAVWSSLEVSRMFMRRRWWQPTPVLLPGKSHGRRSLVGCSPWDREELDWATSLSLFTFMHWRRKWQLTPVSLPGESQGRGSLVGCRLWGHTESDTTKVT